jgi:hypothetical protein
MLQAALAPGADGEAAAVQLVQWFLWKRGVSVGEVAQREGGDSEIAWLNERDGPVKEGHHRGLRLVTSAVRCRLGLRDAPVLESASLILGRFQLILRGVDGQSPDLLAHPMPDPERLSSHRRIEQAQWYRAQAWHRLSLFLPELLPHSCGMLNTEEVDTAAFSFPLVVPALAVSALADASEAWRIHGWRSTGLLQRPDCDLRPHVRLLAAGVHREADAGKGVIEVLAAGLADGRITCEDLIEAFGHELRRKSAAPRKQIAGLRALAERDPAIREAAAAAAERAIGHGVEELLPVDRIAILEALAEWRCAAGRSIESEPALTALAAMAASGGSRAATLARQLLSLTAREGLRPAAELWRLRDVRALVESEDRSA